MLEREFSFSQKLATKTEVDTLTTSLHEFRLLGNGLYNLLEWQTSCGCYRFEKMALMLLYEKQKGRQSVVSGYVDQMPASFDTLLHWSPEELQLLMYPHLIQQVRLKILSAINHPPKH